MAFRCIRVGEKSTALADNAIDRKVILKHALPGFFLLECDEIGEIAREILQKMEVVGDILLCAERVLREQNGKLCLNPERRTERFRKKAGAARHFLAVQLVEQKIEREQVAKVTGTNKDDSAGPKKPVQRKEIKVYPNDPCPCGSGKKYKNCHGQNA